MLRKPQQKEGGAIGPVTPLLQMSGIPLICHLGKPPTRYILLYCFLVWFLQKSTAGIPLKRLSNTHCSVPGRGISGLLRGWLFPFPVIRSVSFFPRFYFRPHLVRKLVSSSSQIKYRSILPSGATGKGKSHALQARFLHPLWYQGGLFMPPLKMLSSETPVSSSRGS